MAYLRAEGCPDDLTIWLCHVCHIRAATKAALAASKTLGGARIERDGQGPGDRGRPSISTPTPAPAVWRRWWRHGGRLASSANPALPARSTLPAFRPPVAGSGLTCRS